MLDKVVRDLFRRGDQPQRPRFGALRASAKPRRPNFALELLEPRLLLSADLNGGVLTGILTAQDDTVVVSLNHTATPDGVAKDGGLIIDLTVNNVLQQFGNADQGVTSIVLQGLAGNDTFTLVDALPIDEGVSGAPIHRVGGR